MSLRLPALRGTAVIVLVHLLSTQLAHAQAPSEAYDRGMRCYNTQDYACAIPAFKSAYQETPKPELLYALAQAYRLSGDCDAARLAYQAFLRSDPPPTERRLAENNLKKCPEPPPAVSVSPAATPSTTPPSPPPLPPDTDHSTKHAFYTDPFGTGLVALGTAGLAVGVGFWVAAANQASDADKATTYGEFESSRGNAEKLRTISIVSASVGLALVIGGVVRWATLRSDPP